MWILFGKSLSKLFFMNQHCHFYTSNNNSFSIIQGTAQPQEFSTDPTTQISGLTITGINCHTNAVPDTNCTMKTTGTRKMFAWVADTGNTRHLSARKCTWVCLKFKLDYFQLIGIDSLEMSFLFVFTMHVLLLTQNTVVHQISTMDHTILTWACTLTEKDFTTNATTATWWIITTKNTNTAPAWTENGTTNHPCVEICIKVGEFNEQ